MFRIKEKLFDKLYFRILVALLLSLVFPFYLMLHYVQGTYQDFIENELSSRAISTIAKGEEDIQTAFQQMAAVTNVFSLDDNLIGALSNEEMSTFERTIAFDSVVSKIKTTNLFNILDMHFIFVDNKGNSYIDSAMENMETNSRPIQDLLQQGKDNNGHLVWSLFSSIFPNQEKEEKYVSVARALFDEEITGDYLGTLIVCVSQTEIGKILSQYCLNDNDLVYLCMGNDGEVLFYLDPDNYISKTVIQKKASSLTGKNGYELQNINHKKFIMSYYQLYRPWGFSGKPMYVLYFTEYTPIVKTFDIFASHLNLILIVCLCVLILVVIALSVSITRPIIRLEKCMKLYSEKQIVTGANVYRKDEIGNLSRTFYDMEIKINDLFNQLKRESEVRERYRYQALRAQINPHFLFNTLNTIRWMAIIRKADNITEMIDALGTILKYSMEREGEFIPLKEELDMINKYIFIQNYRYGKTYLLTTNIPDELMEYPIIKFLLQPVVENAFIHAFKNFDGEPEITISASHDDSAVWIHVCDNGTGVDEQVAEQLNENGNLARKKITGIGLANVNERIQIEYGKNFGIQIKRGENGGSVVKYCLPLSKKNRGKDEEVIDC